MGASANPHWPGRRGYLPEEPDFTNDCKVWADWLVEVVKDSDALDLLDRLGCSALTTFFTHGMDEAEIEWVSPTDLSQAARIVSHLLAERAPEVDYLAELYGRSRYQPADPHGRLSTDLADIAKIADFVTKHGVEQMTMEVNW